MHIWLHEHRHRQRHTRMHTHTRTGYMIEHQKFGLTRRKTIINWIKYEIKERHTPIGRFVKDSLRRKDPPQS